MRTRLTAILVLVLLGLGSMPALAQPGGTVEVTSIAVVLENPRGDSVVLGTVEPGTVLEVLEIRGVWYFIQAPDRRADWRRGWIHARYFEVLTAPPSDPDDLQQPELRTSVRGFGLFGLNYFAASDSFDAVTGKRWGVMYGGGAQLGFSNGLFFQGSYEQYEKTGERVFIFENEIFDLGIENKVTVTPILLSVGYRQATTYRIVGYVGAGVGWHRLQEDVEFGDPADNVDVSKVGYHLLGGFEYPLTRWLWVGAEGQWAYVPDILGDDGVSAAFDEDDLGGFALRVKFSVGL